MLFVDDFDEWAVGSDFFTGESRLFFNRSFKGIQSFFCLC
jgi:hypothetical protein